MTRTVNILDKKRRSFWLWRADSILFPRGRFAPRTAHGRLSNRSTFCCWHSVSSSPLRRKRVLVIEDDAILRQAICQSLIAANFEADFALDGRSGLELSLLFDFDAIILDQMLPGMSGLEILAELRKVKRTPVIIATAKRSTEDRVIGLDCGADDYLVKPYSMVELVARLNALMRRNSPKEP